MPRNSSPTPITLSSREWCSRSDCTTPNCPYRPRKGSSHTTEDLSADCDYFSLSGDGRWGRPLSKQHMSHCKSFKEGSK